MALKAVIEKLEDVPEAVRSEYEPTKDGRFQLNVTDYEDPKLKQALDVERTARQKAEREAKEQKKVWEKLGKSPEEIEKLVADSRDAEQKRLEEAGNFEAVKAQIIEQGAKEVKAVQDKLNAKDGEITTLKTSLQNQLVNVEATAAIAAAKGEPALLLSVVQRRTKVVEKDGLHVVQVLDPKGDPMVDGKGNPVTIADLVDELKQDKVYGRAFDGSGNSGTGMGPGRGNGGSGNHSITKRSDLKTEKERSAFINTHGLEEYQRLPIS